MCGCRKAYLSYPALYTHVKNKHDGVFPIGSNAKRKIPKNFEEETDNVFIPNLEKFYDEFHEFISLVSGAEAKGKPPLTKELVDKLFQVGVAMVEQETQALRNSARGMLSLESDKAKFESMKDNLNIYQILAFYLISIYQYCSDAFFREYIYLIVMVAKSLNEKGELFMEKDEKKKPGSRGDEGHGRQFCESSNIHVTSEILNLFIAELFPSLLKAFKTEALKIDYLGTEDEHIKNLIVMTKFLANWLFNNEFTDYRLEINVDL